MKNLTKSVTDEKAVQIVAILAEVYWTETIQDEEGNEIPNVSKEVLAQKLLTEHCKKFVQHAKGIIRNKELGQIPQEEW
jgi:hypothetical protein